MKLTDGEKLLAVMLSDVLKALEYEGEINPDFVTHAVTGGHLWALKWQYPGLFHDEDVEDEIVNETADILTMSRMVEYSIAQLTPAEQAEIPMEDRQVFVGFDGNAEPHYGVAKFLNENLGRFDELNGREFNSHMPMVPKYRRMLDVYAHVRKGIGDLPLDAIKTIIYA
jgi:uncharacterized protein YfbU (UPF0304 family)